MIIRWRHAPSPKNVSKVLACMLCPEIDYKKLCGILSYFMMAIFKFTPTPREPGGTDVRSPSHDPPPPIYLGGGGKYTPYLGDWYSLVFTIIITTTTTTTISFPGFFWGNLPRCKEQKLIFPRQTPPNDPLSRENGNTQAAPFCARVCVCVGGGGGAGFSIVTEKITRDYVTQINLK